MIRWLGATVQPKGTTGSCYTACELACMQETGGLYVPYVTTYCAAKCYDDSGCANLPETGFEWLPTDTITPPTAPPPTTPPAGTKPPSTAPTPPSSTAKEAFAPTKSLMDVVPAVRPKFEALLAYASSLGLKPTIRSAGRTCAQQNYQKEAGYSQAAMCRSMHTLGHAIDLDLVPSTCASYTKLGEWWEKQGGVWGGRWTQFGACGDAGHYQYGFDGAGAVPTAVCPEGLSLAQCQKLRSDYLTKAMAQSSERGGVGSIWTSLIIAGVAVGFVWATLQIKPGKKLLENPRLRFQEIKNKRVKIYEFDGEYWRDSNDRRVGPAFDQERGAVAYAKSRGWTERRTGKPTSADVNHYVRLRLQQGHGILGGQSTTKIYIADVLGAMRVTKAELLEMHRRGEVTLGRLDLVNALSPAERARMREGEILAWPGAPDTAAYHVVERR